MSNVAQKIFEKNNIAVDVKTGLSEDEIIKIIPEYDGMVVRSATKVTKKILDAASNLKVIGRAGAGVDNIDVPVAKEKNMIVMNTPGGNANATAEHAFALIMSALRKIPFANDTTHKGKWEKKNIKGTELSKKTLGIVGFGNIGQRLAALLEPFNCKILFFDSINFSNQDLNSIYQDKSETFLSNIHQKSLHELLSESEIISIHIPLLAETENLIDVDEFSLMKEDVNIINTSRGGIVNEKALETFLIKNKRYN